MSIQGPGRPQYQNLSVLPITFHPVAHTPFTRIAPKRLLGIHLATQSVSPMHPSVGSATPRTSDTLSRDLIFAFTFVWSEPRKLAPYNTYLHKVPSSNF